MPTRIKPNRTGYVGYACVGIPSPCINPMDGTTNRFKCLPKAATKIVTNTTWENLAIIIEDVALRAAMGTSDTHWDPLNDGVKFDLYGAFVRQGKGALLDESCDYDYTCNEPGGSFPHESQSKRQINVGPGFMDPPSTGMDAIVVLPGIAELESSSSSSSESSSSDSSSSSGGSSLSSSSRGSELSVLSSGCEGISVTVITALDVTSTMAFNFKDRVIYVECADSESDWKLVPGWEVTDCT